MCLVAYTRTNLVWSHGDVLSTLGHSKRRRDNTTTTTTTISALHRAHPIVNNTKKSQHPRQRRHRRYPVTSTKRSQHHDNDGTGDIRLLQRPTSAKSRRTWPGAMWRRSRSPFLAGIARTYRRGCAARYRADITGAPSMLNAPAGTGD